MSAVAAVRIRGNVHVRVQIADTLRYMGLTRKNHCVVLPANETTTGMIKKAKDYITWGEVDEKTILKLIQARGKITGDKKITDQHVKANSKYADLKSLAEAISKGEARLRDVKEAKSVFRLNPPVKGFERKGIKKPFNLGGALGYRGDKIKLLLERMI